MKCILMIFLLMTVIPVRVSALEITAPEAPYHIQEILPEKMDNIGIALPELLENVLYGICPELKSVCGTCTTLFAAMMIASLLHTFSSPVKRAANVAFTVIITALLIQSTDSLVDLAGETIRQLSDYGKLLWPVMTAAMAAQGGFTASAALYVSTAAFDMILSGLISGFLLPLVYAFLGLAVGNSMCGEEALKRLKEFIKSLVSWSLKIVLTIFTTYLSLTGVVNGATDAAALKATKVTISSVVPVVGGIMSDASEAVLVSAAMMKNAAGIYGILVILALFLYPFLKIAFPYLVLKLTAALGAVFAPKEVSGLVEDFATATGLLLAMIGSTCLMFLISVFCFMKGVPW